MAQMGNQPLIVLSEESQRTSGKDAQSMNITAGKAVAEAVRTTLGPKGMDKMLVDSTGNVVVTNDGVTILKEMDIEHPAANMIVEVAETQESEVGDGTTTAVIVAGGSFSVGRSEAKMPARPSPSAGCSEFVSSRRLATTSTSGSSSTRPSRMVTTVFSSLSQTGVWPSSSTALRIALVSLDVWRLSTPTVTASPVMVPGNPAGSKVMAIRVAVAEPRRVCRPSVRRMTTTAGLCALPDGPRT